MMMEVILQKLNVMQLMKLINVVTSAIQIVVVKIVFTMQQLEKQIAELVNVNVTVRSVKLMVIALVKF